MKKSGTMQEARKISQKQREHIPNPAMLPLEIALEQAAMEFAFAVTRQEMALARLALRTAARAMVAAEQATARLLEHAEREAALLLGEDDDDDENDSSGFGGYDGL